MIYFKTQCQIFGYEPAPNRYRKWYRNIEKVEKKIELYKQKLLELKENENLVELELSNEEKEYLTQKYSENSQKEIKDQIKIDYPQFQESNFVVGLYLNFWFDLAVDPNDWFVCGFLVTETEIFRELKMNLPRQKRPERPHPIFVDDWNKSIEQYDKKLMLWKTEWSKF